METTRRPMLRLEQEELTLFKTHSIGIRDRDQKKCGCVVLISVLTPQ